MTSVAALIALACGTIIPGLIALVAREHASAGVKALLTGMLAAVSGVLSGYTITAPHGTAQWEQIGLSIGLAWMASIASYLGVWKPSGAAPAMQKRGGFIGSKGPDRPPTAPVDPWQGARPVG